jgi:XTP/dITP diphosphohydrolase
MIYTEILLASNNEHKHREFTRLFPGLRVLTPGDLGIGFEFEENGQTFLDNAFGKARALRSACARLQLPVMADDSGLCVRALDGQPGIFSSRYGSSDGGAPLAAPRRNAHLLERMQGIGDRAAYFVCCLVVAMDEARFIIVQETVHGTIADAPRGAHGFGYDPLFLVSGRGMTMAELADEEKDVISHRGKAARRMRAALGQAE